MVLAFIAVNHAFFQKEPYQQSPEKYNIAVDESDVNVDFSADIFKADSVSNSTLYDSKYGTILLDNISLDTDTNDDYVLFLKFSGKRSGSKYCFLSPYSYDSKTDVEGDNCRLKVSFSVNGKKYEYERPWSHFQVTSSNSVSMGFNIFRSDAIWEEVKNLDSLEVNFQLLNLEKQTWRKK